MNSCEAIFSLLHNESFGIDTLPVHSTRRIWRDERKKYALSDTVWTVL